MRTLIDEWHPLLLSLSDLSISSVTNSQNRSIRQIVGHMIDSASNNTHRIIHLQYQTSPLIFPDYANLGVNDTWIAIQNFQEEAWEPLVQLWKYINLHLCYVMEQVDERKLNNEWISALNEKVTLNEMILDYPNHFKLHLGEIEALMNR